MDTYEIKKIGDGLNPIDWGRMRMIANLSPSKRVERCVQAAEKELASLRKMLHLTCPFLSDSEVNMKSLAHFTPVTLPEDHLLNPKHIDEIIANHQP